MADAPSAQDLFLVGRAEAVTGPTRFDQAIIDVDGSDVNVVFRVAASMGEEVARYLQLALNELTLANARGTALDRLVFDRYQLTRKRSNTAVVTVELQRAGAVGFTMQAGSLVGTDTGQIFSTISDVAFAANVLGPLSVQATATAAGRGGNVLAGTIIRVLSAQADGTLSVTNPAAAAGGTDDETDDQLRDRARQFFLTARRGTKSAIEFGALEVAGVVQAQAIEVLSPTGIPVYRVQLYIADPEGQANTALASAVRLALEEFRAFGVPVQVVPAVPQYVNVTATGLQFAAGSNTTAVLDLAAASVLAAVNSTLPGETLTRARILAALSSVDGLIVPAEALTEPVGDLVPATGTVIRTTRDRITLGG